MAKKKHYKWIMHLIDKITQSDAPLNNYFNYYGYEITQMSGTVDYTDVYIRDGRNTLADFSFDFWTKELNFESYENDELRFAIVDAFVSIYEEVNVSDNTINERKSEYQEYIDNPEEYVEEAVEKAKKEMEIIENLPIGWVNRNLLNGLKQ